MIDVDTIANGRFTVGELAIIINDVACDFGIGHDFVEVGGVEVAVVNANVIKVDVFDSSGDVLKAREIAELDKMID